MKQLQKIVLLIAVVMALGIQMSLAQNSTAQVAILIVDDFDHSHDLTLNHDPGLQSAAAQLRNNIGQLIRNDNIQATLQNIYNEVKNSIHVPGANTLDSADTCAVNLPSITGDGQGNYVKTGLSDSTLMYPHGYYVAYTAREAVSLVPNHADIQVIEVDTDSYRAADVLQQIRTYKNDLAANGVQAFVVNMSFGYIPCDPNVISILAYYDMVAGEINRARLDKEVREKNDIREDDVKRSFEAVQAELVNIISSADKQIRDTNHQYDCPTTATTKKSDELTFCDLLQVLIEDNTIAVAAAGNLGEKYFNNDLRLNQIGMYPLAPAILSTVVSVGALDPTAPNTQRASWSNAAEVLMNGYILDPVTGELMRGTSFAAPRLSAILANYLVSQGGTDICNRSGIPALKYIPLQNWVDDYENSGTSITAVNLDLATATVESSCPQIP